MKQLIIMIAVCSLITCPAVSLAGRGTVYSSPLKLVQYENGKIPLANENAWWSDRTAGRVGGITGSVIGLTGGLIGLLVGMGRARNLAHGLLLIMFLFGILGLIFGLAALILSQPYAVYYPLLLVGVLCTVLPVALRRSVCKRYQDIELRKMKALDV